jgi:hypothetical protein
MAHGAKPHFSNKQTRTKPFRPDAQGKVASLARSSATKFSLDVLHEYVAHGDMPILLLYFINIHTVLNNCLSPFFDHYFLINDPRLPSSITSTFTTMKIIATSIVLLAATASAGETSLRIGRRKLGTGGNGNANGKGNGNAYGYGHCCRVAKDVDAEDFQQECKKLSKGCEEYFGKECKYAAANTDTGEDQDCFLVDDSSDSESKGGSGEE